MALEHLVLPFEWQSQTQDFSLLMSFSFDILTDQHLTCCIKMASLCQTLDIWYMLWDCQGGGSAGGSEDAVFSACRTGL